MLTDTTFWVDLLRERARGQRGPAHEFIAEHRTRELRVSVVTWGELAVGFAASGDLQRLLSGIRVLMLPLQIAWEASRIERELSTQGLRLGENDTWIAATARAWGFTLVSNDAAFRRVRRLKVVSYPEP